MLTTLRACLLLAAVPPLAAQTLTISPATLPLATAYEAYGPGGAGVTLSANGTAPWIWTCTAGCTFTGAITLASAYNPSNPGTPTLFQWNPATATITGIPDGCATFDQASFAPCPLPFEPMSISPSFTISVTDANHLTGNATYTLMMNWNPTQAAFESQQMGYFSQMVTRAGTGAQPPMKIAGMHQISNAKYRTAAGYDLQTAWNAWVDMMSQAGISVMWIYPDVDCFIGLRSACITMYSSIIARAHGYGMSVGLSPVFTRRRLAGARGAARAVPPMA